MWSEIDHRRTRKAYIPFPASPTWKNCHLLLRKRLRDWHPNMRVWSATLRNSQENTITKEKNWFYKLSRNQRKDMIAHFKEECVILKRVNQRRNWRQLRKRRNKGRMNIGYRNKNLIVSSIVLPAAKIHSQMWDYWQRLALIRNLQVVYLTVRKESILRLRLRGCERIGRRRWRFVLTLVSYSVVTLLEGKSNMINSDYFISFSNAIIYIFHILLKKTKRYLKIEYKTSKDI